MLINSYGWEQDINQLINYVIVTEETSKLIEDARVYGRAETRTGNYSACTKLVPSVVVK
jgi:hypothetical protein